ncbi:MAG: ZPR1 zinc finger domain-containing protein [Candidatus Thorarchaeota archaeon]|nr:ZPR1 zinc finger domain-containing protein [Candidatus Thorarchaeota archaeon]
MSSKEDLTSKCPVCTTGKLIVNSMLYSVPFFNELAMFTMKCPECGFSHSDVFSAEQRRPTRFTLHVDDVSLLNVRVVRSGSCTYRFPEWGIDVEPGPAADAFVTNVEGLLFRVRSVVETALGFADEESERKRAKQILDEIMLALRGDYFFTLVMEDPAGVSGILPDDLTLVKIEELSPEETSHLKGAPFWIDTMREEISERKG